MVIVYKIIAAGLMAALNPTVSGDPSKVKPLAMLQGGDSKMQVPLVRMIRDARTWKELWIMHKGLPVLPGGQDGIVNGDAPSQPKVDFDKNQVLVVFGGQMTNVQAFDYVKTVPNDKSAVIQIAPNPFPAHGTDVIMQPYIMLVLPNEPVMIQVDLQTTARDGTTGWNRIASFAAAKPKPKS